MLRDDPSTVTFLKVRNLDSFLVFVHPDSSFLRWLRYGGEYIKYHKFEKPPIKRPDVSHTRHRRYTRLPAAVREMTLVFSNTYSYTSPSSVIL